MSATKKVILAYPYSIDGKDHAADTTVSLPLAVADDLLYFGRARLPESKAAKAAETSKEK